MAQTFRQLAERLQRTPQGSAANATLRDLIAALDGAEDNFDLTRLYQLNFQDFELAMALIADWRFRRNTRPGARLHELLAHA